METLIEIGCLLAGALVGLIFQKCFDLVDSRKQSAGLKNNFFKIFNRLAIHCFLVGSGLIILVILFGGGVGETAELFIGGFLIAGCIWCWVLSVREKRRQPVAVETDPNTSE